MRRILRDVEASAKPIVATHQISVALAVASTMSMLVVFSTAALQDTPAARFTEVAVPAGVHHIHAYVDGRDVEQIARVGGGVAAGDYDGDGWVDLYAVAGDTGANRLFRNRGDGTFEEVGETAGVALGARRSSGPVFADYDGDGYVDLFVGAVDSLGPTLFRNLGNGTFGKAPSSEGLFPIGPYNSSAFGDYDRDGDLDLFVTHWGLITRARMINHLWRNEGDGTFSPAPGDAGLVIRNDGGPLEIQWTFSPNFADIDSDGWPDILLSSDFKTSQVFLNNRDGTFADVTTDVISDENGMGAAVGDYDNDGDLDWFVSSIFDPTGVPAEEWGATGNRFYRNRGDGTFEDVTDAAGVRDGSWGWASCFADFDNDGHLDLFHVNGWDLSEVFNEQPARLFISNGDGSFVERAADAGVADRGDGRGLVCFDYDRDGDVDIFIANNGGPSRLFRNDSDAGHSFLNVRLRGRVPNTQAIGARVYVGTGAVQQMRELRAGCNYVSQDPAEAHFGLAAHAIADEVRVVWPDGAATVRLNVAANRMLIVNQDPGDANCDRRLTAADLVRSALLRGAALLPGCGFADVDGDGAVGEGDTADTLRLVFGG